MQDIAIADYIQWRLIINSFPRFEDLNCSIELIQFDLSNGLGASVETKGEALGYV